MLDAIVSLSILYRYVGYSGECFGVGVNLNKSFFSCVYNENALKHFIYFTLTNAMEEMISCYFASRVIGIVDTRFVHEYIRMHTGTCVLSVDERCCVPSWIINTRRIKLSDNCRSSVTKIWKMFNKFTILIMQNNFLIHYLNKIKDKICIWPYLHCRASVIQMLSYIKSYGY